MHPIHEAHGRPHQREIARVLLLLALGIDPYERHPRARGGLLSYQGRPKADRGPQGEAPVVDGLVPRREGSNYNRG